ncbi:MAG: hypothetical protein INR64_20195 [Caulobacteraceae bacterium]|nr:hypothetical protein [Caulobacter sp.]
MITLADLPGLLDKGLLAGAIDVILLLVGLEALALVLWHRATGRGPAPRAILAMLAAGFFLMLATRLALGDAGTGLIAACLLAALAAHVGDLAARWPRG